MADNTGCDVGTWMFCDRAGTSGNGWRGRNEGPGAGSPSVVEMVVNGLKVTFLGGLVGGRELDGDVEVDLDVEGCGIVVSGGLCGRW